MRGTLFNELDDDKLHKVIDFAEFEEMFKLPGSGGVVMTNGTHDVDGLTSQPSKRFKKPETVSLLEHTRLRNIGECSTYKAATYREFLEYWGFRVNFLNWVITRKNNKNSVHLVFLPGEKLFSKIVRGINWYLEILSLVFF